MFDQKPISKFQNFKKFPENFKISKFQIYSNVPVLQYPGPYWYCQYTGSMHAIVMPQYTKNKKQYLLAGIAIIK